MDTNQFKKYEPELIQSIQRGDKETFAELYKAYFSGLCNFAHRYIDQPTICEELVQDLFLSIWKRREEWDPQGSVRSYLFKAARNRSLDYLKHMEVQRNYLEARKIELQMERDSLKYQQEYDLAVDERISKHDTGLAKAIDEAIDQLPERRKIIFLLSREDGLTYQEIADILEISVKTVETQMGRSLKTLRDYLSHYLPGFVAITEFIRQLV